MRNAIMGLLATLILLVGASAIYNQPAHAAGGHTGICDSSLNNSECWYETLGGAATMFTRNITYNLRESYIVYYDGTVQSTGCDIGGIPDVGVYSFDSGANARWVGAGYTPNGGVQYYLGDQVNLDNYARWAWLPSGVLENCGDAAGSGCQYAYAIPDANWAPGDQLYTECLRTAATWDQYDPPYRGPSPVDY
jgi:hypothetical protein